MYCIKLVISILQNNCYSKFLKLLENNVNFLKQNHFIKKQNICSANIILMFLNNANLKPFLTISKSFYFKRYYYISNYLKTLYGSQNHTRINSRSRPIRNFKTIPNKSQSLFLSKYWVSISTPVFCHLTDWSFSQNARSKWHNTGVLVLLYNIIFLYIL